MSTYMANAYISNSARDHSFDIIIYIQGPKNKKVFENLYAIRLI